MHLASQTMALDGVTTGDATLGWPGDMSGVSWAGWATNLVPNYLSQNDFSKLLSAAGFSRPNTTAPATKDPTAVNAYAVAENSGGDTVFLSSANWSNGQALTPAGKPYGDKGSSYFRKAGDGAIFSKAISTTRTLSEQMTNALQ